jgi:osmotically inducible lipoprotein OsmB
MRSLIKAGILVLALAAIPDLTLGTARAGTMEGAAIGAGSGLLIAGPPGAVVGGVIGAVVGGPDIARPRYRNRNCWTNRYGERRCNRR